MAGRITPRINYKDTPTNMPEDLNSGISSFMTTDNNGGNIDDNIDKNTVESFGSEWLKFNEFSQEEIDLVGKEYFDIVNFSLFKNANVLDVGCGSGRWSLFLHDKVGFIEAIDPSAAVLAADKLLANCPNIRISQAGVSNIPFEDDSFDLVFSLGVLHHVPNTIQAIKDCVKKVKPGGYFLVYLYYALDNRSAMYKAIFKSSVLFRKIISSLPAGLKKVLCDLIAAFVYMPFVALSKIVKALFPSKKYYESIPLNYYMDKSWFIIRNDALDRFGTPLEQRFSKKEIEEMMLNAGLKNIVFSENAPYWHAIGQKI